MKLRWTALGALGMVLAACGHSSPPASSLANANRPGPLVLSSPADKMLGEQLGLTPDLARYSGLHDWDGQVADYSAAGLADRVAKLRARKQAIKTTARAGDDDALDLDLLDWNADEQLFWLTERNSPAADPSFYEELFSLNGYIDREYAEYTFRFEKLVQHEERALFQIPHIRENLKLPLAKPLVEVGIGIYKGYAEYLRADVVQFAAKNTDPKLAARFKASNDALASEAQKLAEWLGTVPTDDSHVLGKDRFQKLVDVYAGQHLSLDDFEKMGNAQLAKDGAIYDQLAPGVKSSKPTAANLISTAQRLTEDARRFIVDHHIVTMPSNEKATVIETPPYKRFNAAWLDTGGPFDPPLGAFFYVTPPDASWPADQQLAYIPLTSELRATSTHEVYPGHFVQYMWLRKTKTLTQKIISSVTFVEGWAHYGEQMMAEEGFSADPENHLGQVAESMLRDCRFLVALGVHTKGMTMAEAQERFVKECHQSGPVAKEQSTRAAFHPWYFAYTLGKLQILALRDDAKKAQGPRFGLQKFHDALLTHGQGPVGLIRPRVLKDLATAP